MAGFTEELRARLYKLGTTNLSDAMDALGFSNVCCHKRHSKTDQQPRSPDDRSWETQKSDMHIRSYSYRKFSS